METSASLQLIEMGVFLGYTKLTPQELWGMEYYNPLVLGREIVLWNQYLQFWIYLFEYFFF